MIGKFPRMPSALSEILGECHTLCQYGNVNRNVNFARDTYLTRSSVTRPNNYMFQATNQLLIRTGMIPGGDPSSIFLVLLLRYIDRTRGKSTQKWLECETASDLWKKNKFKRSLRSTEPLGRFEWLLFHWMLHYMRHSCPCWSDLSPCALAHYLLETICMFCSLWNNHEHLAKVSF